MNTIYSQPNRRLLVIDDNRAIHEDFRKILGEPDTSALAAAEGQLFGRAVPVPFQIDSAYQGQEALAMVETALAEERPYAMAFLDVRMPPGWDGIETAKRIWAVYPDLQLVICTAYSDYTWADMSEVIGPLERFLILKKPFDTIEVVQMAHALTEKWRLLQQAKSKLSDLERMVGDRTIDLEQARIAALNMMEDAVEARTKTELANEDLKRQITERKQAEQRLATQHAVTQALAESTTVSEAAAKILQVACQKLEWDVGLLWTFDRTKNHVRCVEIWHPPSAEFGEFAAFSRLMAFAPGEGLPGRVWESGQPVWIADLAKEADSPRKSLLAPLGLHSAVGFPIKLRDETLGVIEFFSVQIQLPDTELVAMFAAAGTQIGQFIERKQLEEQFRQSQKMEAFGQLAGGVAHDFNNILGVIQGYVHLLMMDEQRNPDDEQGLRQILSAAERAASLTRQLLMFSRRQEALLKPVLLRDSIDDVAKMLRRLIGEQIKLQIRHASTLLMISADAGMMDQVVMNLVVNARDAMPQGGEITISTEAVAVDHEHAARNSEARVGPHACLSVGDTGSGIPPETLSRIFEPFFTTKEVGKGTGLGLATVYGIVKQHEGWIEVESQVGVGTVFKVFLPAVTQSVNATENKIDTSLVKRGHETILLVEDEAPLRALTRAVLERYGYRVIEAVSGVDALAQWEQCGAKVDLLLTDMVMPDGLTGRQLAKQLQAIKPDLKVIYTTGYSINLEGTSFHIRDGCNFLQKPYRPERLFKAIRESLDQKS
jgi:two-component system, cell cycle sensor histidine kinase and response regulator CckA